MLARSIFHMLIWMSSPYLLDHRMTRMFCRQVVVDKVNDSIVLRTWLRCSQLTWNDSRSNYVLDQRDHSKIWKYVSLQFIYI